MFSLRKVIFRSPDTSILARLILVAIVIVAVSPVVALAAATSQPTTHPTTAPADLRLMARSLSDLASPDAEVREVARTQLMRLTRPDLNSLQRLVERSQPLAPSQAAALRQIVREVYLAGEDYEKDPTKGFLGILMDKSALGTRDLQQPNDIAPVPGVVVEDRIPGFCASRMLRDGDIILGMAEPPQPFNSPNDLQLAIAGLEPGSVVRLQVLRHGQLIEVEVTLDSRPLEADGMDSAESFRDRRAKKFEEYWQANFTNLLKARLG